MALEHLFFIVFTLCIATSLSDWYKSFLLWGHFMLLNEENWADSEWTTCFNVCRAIAWGYKRKSSLLEFRPMSLTAVLQILGIFLVRHPLHWTYVLPGWWGLVGKNWSLLLDIVRGCLIEGSWLLSKKLSGGHLSKKVHPNWGYRKRRHSNSCAGSSLSPPPGGGDCRSTWTIAKIFQKWL